MPSGKTMMSRVEWLKFVMSDAWPRNRPLHLLIFAAFEPYYQFCNLTGYPARHFLEPPPEGARSVRAGERILLTWPRLPLWVRLLDRIIPFGRGAHAEFAPYTDEAAAAARAAGRRVSVIEVVAGEFKMASR